GGFPDALLALRSEGFIAEMGRTLHLAHPGLLAAYRNALGGSLSAQGHRLWRDALLSRHPSPAQVADTPRIVRHALALGDTETARAWGQPSVEFLFNNGRFHETVAVVDVLLPLSVERMEKVILLGHRAPSLYRLGRFDEAVKSYDDWYATKGDDETKVET